MRGLVRGALEGYTGFMKASSLGEEEQFRRNAETRAQEEFGLRKQALEQQLAAGNRDAARQAQLDGIDQQIMGMPAAELAGPEVPGQDRVQSGLSRPATAPLTGAGLYDAMGRKALLRNDAQGFASAQQMKRSEALNAAINSGLKNANTPGFLTDFLPESFRSHPTISVSKPDEKGFQYVTVGDMKPIPLSPQQMKTLAIAQELQNQGFGAEAMKYIEGVDKDLAAQVAAVNAAQMQAVQTNTQSTQGRNTAIYQSGQLEIGRRQAAASERQAGAAEARARADIDNGRLGTIQYFQDKDGNVRSFIPTLTNGKLDWAEQAVPTGMRPFKPSAEGGPKVNPDGSITKDGKVFVPDPKNPGKYMPAQGLEPSALDKAIEAKLRGQPTPGAGGAPQQVEVPGRPLYNTPTEQLQEMAKRPRGVSPAEAAAAAEELRLRQGESRMSGF